MYPLLVGLTVAYFVAASVTTFDIRLLQAKRRGALPPGAPMLPPWVALFHWTQWALFLTMLVINWKFALIIFAIKAVLKVLPVLEVLGNVILSPLKWRA